MSMKRNILSGALLALISTGALAEELNAGTVHFTGEIITPSCAMEDMTVPLGTHPTTYFDEVGTETQLVPFTIELTGCPLSSVGLPNVQLTFNGDSELTGDTTLLDVSKVSTAGDTAATGVGIAVSLADNSSILLPMDGGVSGVSLPLSSSADGSVSAAFNARYKSFSETVTAGPADADMTVNIVYQ
ncbi:type 1 fimbrial protein [Salmonella enterica]|nr:type 1 fimbrial protein [Salmonella enterica]